MSENGYIYFCYNSRKQGYVGLDQRTIKSSLQLQQDSVTKSNTKNTRTVIQTEYPRMYEHINNVLKRDKSDGCARFLMDNLGQLGDIRLTIKPASDNNCGIGSLPSQVARVWQPTGTQSTLTLNVAEIYWINTTVIGHSGYNWEKGGQDNWILNTNQIVNCFDKDTHALETDFSFNSQTKYTWGGKGQTPQNYMPREQAIQQFVYPILVMGQQAIGISLDRVKDKNGTPLITDDELNEQFFPILQNNLEKLANKTISVDDIATTIENSLNETFKSNGPLVTKIKEYINHYNDIFKSYSIEISTRAEDINFHGFAEAITRAYRRALRTKSNVSITSLDKYQKYGFFLTLKCTPIYQKQLSSVALKDLLSYRSAFIADDGTLVDHTDDVKPDAIAEQWFNMMKAAKLSYNNSVIIRKETQYGDKMAQAK